MNATGPADNNDWYDPAVYPEWRDGAPWVMEDMIAAQAGLLVDVADRAGDGVAQLAHLVGEATAAGQPVVACAVGTAGHAARGVAVALNDGAGDGAGRAVEFRESADQALHPRDGGVCVAVSHGGRSRSTIEALTAAKERGARTVLITAADGTPAQAGADMVINLPLRDKSYCHTVGYTTPIMVGLLAGGEMKGQPLDLAATAAYMEGLAGMAAEGDVIGRNMAGITRFIAAGSLVDEPSARELALDMAEAAWVPSSVFGVEDVLHGHMVAHDSDSGLCAIVTGGPNLDRAARTANSLLKAAARIGLHTTAILIDTAAGEVEESATTAGRLVVPSAGVPAVVATLLGGAHALQHLTIGLVHQKGTNPDLLRRDVTPWREAVSIGSAKA